jgi:tetratricopeptide (TPR) repeat protein
VSRLERWYLRQVAAWCLTFGLRTPAMNCYERILAANPDDVDTLASEGFELARAGRKREALARFERVVALDPSRAEPWFNLGFLAQELNDHDKAIASFRRALELNPDHDRALYGEALSLIATRRLDEAVPLLERNTKLQPMSPYGWYQLGRVQHDRGKPERTQVIIDHLAKFEPKVAAQLARETGLRAPPRP